MRLTSAHRRIAENSSFNRVKWRNEIVWVSLTRSSAFIVGFLFSFRRFCDFFREKINCWSKAMHDNANFWDSFFFSNFYVDKNQMFKKIKSLDLWISTMSLNTKGVHYTDFFLKKPRPPNRKNNGFCSKLNSRQRQALHSVRKAFILQLF